MIEDLIMEFDEVPENTAETLAGLRAAQGEIAAALGAIMVGLVEIPIGWNRILKLVAGCFFLPAYSIHSNFGIC